MTEQDNKVTSKIAMQIIRKREAKGISQRALARKTNLSDMQILRIEKARQSGSLESLAKIAEVLGFQMTITFEEIE